MRLHKFFLYAAIAVLTSCAQDGSGVSSTTQNAESGQHDHQGSGHNHHDHQHASSDEWDIYEGDSYQIEYPLSWQVSGRGQIGADFSAAAPLDSEEDQFRENVSLLVQDLSGIIGEEVTLDDFAKLSEEQIKSLMTDAEISQNEKIVSDDRTYQQMIFTARQGLFDLKFKQHSFVENDMAYILTFSAEVDKFEAYAADGDKMLNSFSIND